MLILLLIVAAALNQFSGAVADTLTTSGNLSEITHGRMHEKSSYVFVGGGAIALTWSADTLAILALASPAFAFYYFMQCFAAYSVSKSFTEKIRLLPIAAVLGFITIFTVPAG